MTNSGAVNPIREAEQRRWPGPARLVSIQVPILERPWTNDQISCRATKQVSHFNLENSAVNGLSGWLSGFVEKSDLGASLSDYKGQKKEKVRVIEPSAPGNFFFELFLFFWCCFDVVGLILHYSPPQGTVNTEGLGEDELGQDKRHTHSRGCSPIPIEQNCPRGYWHIFLYIQESIRQAQGCITAVFSPCLGFLKSNK